ncbi:hypothetical protein, partial [Mycobacterium sp.]|uniref:hypothetical protein n=1 Tax=Mycobacterium sp. TaxID=1785 RepID=UPI002F40050D
MASPMPAHQAVPGSNRVAPFGTFRLRDAEPTASVEATLVLRRAGLGITMRGELAIPADPDDIAAIETFASAHGL